MAARPVVCTALKCMGDRSRGVNDGLLLVCVSEAAASALTVILANRTCSTTLRLPVDGRASFVQCCICRDDIDNEGLDLLKTRRIFMKLLHLLIKLINKQGGFSVDRWIRCNCRRFRIFPPPTFLDQTLSISL
jgi:hypothetical protein